MTAHMEYDFKNDVVRAQHTLHCSNLVIVLWPTVRGEISGCHDFSAGNHHFVPPDSARFSDPTVDTVRRTTGLLLDHPLAHGVGTGDRHMPVPCGQDPVRGFSLGEPDGR